MMKRLFLSLLFISSTAVCFAQTFDVSYFDIDSEYLHIIFMSDEIEGDNVNDIELRIPIRKYIGDPQQRKKNLVSSLTFSRKNISAIFPDETYILTEHVSEHSSPAITSHVDNDSVGFHVVSDLAFEVAYKLLNGKSVIIEVSDSKTDDSLLIVNAKTKSTEAYRKAYKIFWERL